MGKQGAQGFLPGKGLGNKEAEKAEELRGNVQAQKREDTTIRRWDKGK